MPPTPSKSPRTDAEFDIVKLRQEAQQIVEESPLYKKFIDGTPLENDISTWMALFASSKSIAFETLEIELGEAVRSEADCRQILELHAEEANAFREQNTYLLAQIAVKDEALEACKPCVDFAATEEVQEAGGPCIANKAFLAKQLLENALTNSPAAAKELLDRQAMLKEQIRVADVAFNGLNDRHNELLEQHERMKVALQKLACLGNGDKHGNSVGNEIAIAALSTPTQPAKVNTYHGPMGCTGHIENQI